MTDCKSIPALIDSLASKHGATSMKFRPALLTALKERMAQKRKSAEEQLLRDKNGTQCARALSACQDELIIALHELAVSRLYPAVNPSKAEHLSVIAVGGYGRGALAPGSDIDLLFLLPYKQTAWGESVVEFILYFLWDLGFKVGHSTRSVDECIRLAKSDETIMTSVLETRMLCGDRALYDELVARFEKDIVRNGKAGFIRAKLAERDNRHMRTGESRYLVEPNVKDGKGGLRDLHTLFWIAKFVYGARQADDFVKAGVFERDDLEVFRRCEDFLWAVRCHLHFMTGRGDDRLSFDRQAEVARRLGFTGSGRMKHVERFMHRYFLVAKDVGDLTGILCAILEQQHIKQAPRMTNLLRRLVPSRQKTLRNEPDFTIVNGRLDFANSDVCKTNPVNMLRLFELGVRHNMAIHPAALKVVHRSLDLIDEALCVDEKANRSFMTMLTGSRDPEAVLRRLNEAGVLGRFIPDFGKIVAMMQFNMYHHYTVDEHLIRAVGFLSLIEKGKLEEDHPLASILIRGLSKSSRKVLYVAVLLHDIAKGRPESHSTAGERVAMQLCPRLGLSPAETEMTAWLVRWHLLMSDTAQSRDLNDFKTILDFTAIVQTPERLKLLLILTVVDIRAVGPGVWNGWKGQLLRTLYEEAEPVISGGHARITRKQRLETAHAQFMDEAKDLPAKTLKQYIARHYDPYWLAFDAKTHAAHARFVARAEKAGQVVACDVRTNAFTAITELTVLAPDHPRLLSLLTGACAAAGANIAGAHIFTTRQGMALDTILIQRDMEDDDESVRAVRLTRLIDDLLHGNKRLRDVLSKRKQVKSRTAAFSVEPRVIIDNDSSNKHTVIELTGLDRIGLLHDLTEALFRLNINIVSAHIATFGERAVDVFYVSDLTGAKITNASRRNAITRKLTAALAGKPLTAGTADPEKAA